MNSREIHTKFIRNSCEFRTNSREFTPMNRLQACRPLAPLVWGAVWAWWMLLGRDLHSMMRNEAGGTILPPQIPQKEPKIWHFPPKTSKFGSIHVNIRAPFKRPLIARSRTVHPLPSGISSAFLKHFKDELIQGAIRLCMLCGLIVATQGALARPYQQQNSGRKTGSALHD